MSNLLALIFAGAPITTSYLGEIHELRRFLRRFPLIKGPNIHNSCWSQNDVGTERSSCSLCRPSTVHGTLKCSSYLPLTLSFKLDNLIVGSKPAHAARPRAKELSLHR